MWEARTGDPPCQENFDNPVFYEARGFYEAECEMAGCLDQIEMCVCLVWTNWETAVSINQTV